MRQFFSLRRVVFLSIFLFCFSLFISLPALKKVYATGNTTQEAQETTSNKEDKNNKENEKEEEKEEEEEEEKGVSWGLVSEEEEEKEVGNITVQGQNIKEINFNGIKLTGNFIQTQPGVYVGTGSIKPDWSFNISLGAVGQITIDTVNKKITGVGYIEIPVYGKIAQITDLIVSPEQIKFKGKFTEKIDISGVELQLAQGLIDFEISKIRIACQASGSVSLAVSIGRVDLGIDIVEGEAGFSVSIPPKGIKLEGTADVTIPFEPPIEVGLEGEAAITKDSLSGEGSATIFDVIKVAEGSIEIRYDGKIKIVCNLGASTEDTEDLIKLNLAGVTFDIDIPASTLKAKLSQDISILDGLITIPGVCKGDLLIDGKNKILSISGATGIGFPLVGITTEQTSVGIKNFLLKITNFNSSNPTIDLAGDLYLSAWTLTGFSGSIKNAILEGNANFYLPPGLKQLLDVEKVSLPIRLSLRAGQIGGELGGEVAGLFIKHFPLVGPTITIKKDGVHLKGQIGIANVITIPLGDLVFTKNERYTKISGDIGLGPFTVGEAEVNLPTNENLALAFSGKIGIPGLNEKVRGNIYNDGKVELKSISHLGLLKVKRMAKFSVSSSALHVDDAEMSYNLAGLSSCALKFSSLDITPQLISGTATATFSNLIGIRESLTGNFSFDGNEIILAFPNPVNIIGIDVRDVVFKVSPAGFSGSGKIVSPGGQTINITMRIENGALKLIGPMGEVISTLADIAEQTYETSAEIAGEEKEVISEDADKVMDNLSRMTEPWAKDLYAVLKRVKDFYNNLKKIIEEKIIAKVKQTLDTLKDKIDKAVAEVKKAIDNLVDTFCDAIKSLISSIERVISEIESLIPDQFKSNYYSIKNKVLSAANALKQQVEIFRSATKYALYNFTDIISQLYQKPLDYIGQKATEIAESIKRQIEPLIKEIDQLLTEIGKEIDAATNKAGQEAQKHYDAAKQKAEVAKQKATRIINDYIDKLDTLISPYVDEIKRQIQPYIDQVESVKNQAIDAAFAKFKELQKQLEPYLKPFKDAINELEGILKTIGGEALKKFNEALKAAGDAFNRVIGALGSGLVKVTDVLGDAFVGFTDFLADVSESVHEFKEAAVEEAKELVDKTVQTAEEIKRKAQDIYDKIFGKKESLSDIIDRLLTELERFMRQKANEFKSKSAGTYNIDGVTVVVKSNGEVEITYGYSISGGKATLEYKGGTVYISGEGQFSLYGLDCDGRFKIDSKKNIEGEGKVNIPGVGKVEFAFTGTSSNVLGNFTYNFGGFDFNTTISMSDKGISINGNSKFKDAINLTLNYTNGQLSAYGTGNLSLGGLNFNTTVSIPSSGQITVYGNSKFKDAINLTLNYTNGQLSAYGTGEIKLGRYSFQATASISSDGMITVQGSNSFTFAGKTITFNLNYENGVLSAVGTADITVAGVGFHNCVARISSNGQFSISGQATVTYYYPCWSSGICSRTATAYLEYDSVKDKFSYSYSL